MLNKVALSLATLLFAGSAMAVTLPDTPVPFKQGTGAMVGNQIYIGLGTAGQDWYAIDTKAQQPKWKKVAKFPGTVRDQSQATVIDGKIYVIGGIGKATPSASRISVLNEVYSYDPQTNKWTKINTRAPLGLAGHSMTTVDGKMIVTVGSVNKAIFDGYFEDIEREAKNKKELDKVNADYMGKKTQDYFFNEKVMGYEPATNLWYNLGNNPMGGTAGAAITVNDGQVFVVGGERKPGLRTDKATQFKVENYGLVFSDVPALIAPKTDKVQEGIAQGFAGVSNGTVLVGGGANFPGSTMAYDVDHKNFAHEGKTKTWRDEIYAYVDGKWLEVGKLPQPVAAAVAIQNGDEVVLVGGETTGGQATSKVVTLKYVDGKLVTEYL